ncbi:MAG: hypothetical protein KF768_01160 [Phycisphaeraceae bacterium]|nr:hypothetical protein [Phycisphaeraceae bacterium]
MRFTLLLSAGVWSFAMLVIGLLMVFEWPGRFGPIVGGGPGGLGGWLWPLAGAAAVAAGEYVFVMLLREMFPRAAPGLIRIASWAPWMAFAVLGPIGVMMWSNR